MEETKDYIRGTAIIGTEAQAVTQALTTVATMKMLRKTGFYLTLLFGALVFKRYDAVPKLAAKPADRVTAMHGHYVDTPIDKNFLHANKANA